MNTSDIEYMWKVATNDPNHDTNWYDPVVVAFAKLVANHTWRWDNEPDSASGPRDCAAAIRARGQV